MSQTSCTIANLAFIALLMSGCALAPLSRDEDPASGHVDSNPPVETSPQNVSDQATDRLSARLRDLRANDPERYAQIQRQLDATHTDVPLKLRKAMREQFEAMLLGEAQRQTEPSQPDHVQLSNWPPKKPIVENSRLFTAEPESVNANPADSVSPTTVPVKVAEPEGTAVQPANHAKPVAQSHHEVADRVEREPGEPVSASEVEDLTMGKWHEHLSEAIDTLEKELVRFDLDEEQAARWNTYLRLLYVVGNQSDRAVEPIDSLTDDERDYWKHLLYGLHVSLDADGKHVSSRRAALALRDLRAASDHLANISTLDVKGLAFCPQVLSFGNIVEYDSRAFDPNQEILLYVEVDNFAAEQKGDQYETQLMAEYSVFDSRGVRVANVVLPSDKQLCNNRRRDYFIAYPLNIPGELPSGTYTLQLTIEDVIGKKSNMATIDFRIR